MKKLVLSLTAICAAVSLNAQITYDVETVLISPASGGSVPPGVTVVDFRYTNNGPDALPQGDTIYMGYWIDNDLFSLTHVANQVSGVILPGPVASGTSITAAQLTGGAGLSIDLTGKADGTSVCIAFFGTGTEVLSGPDSEDTDLTNNEDCFSVLAASASIEESSLETTVYPNPASGVLNVKSNEQIESITILSLDGKTVASSVNTTSVDVAGLNTGLYIYSVKTVSGKVSTSKFMKK